MAVDKPVPVPAQDITSIDVVNFDGGLNLNGAQNAPQNSFIDSKDVELSIDGFLGPRRVLTPFLPDTVGTSYQKAPVIWNGLIYYFTVDMGDGQAKFCQEGDNDWTICDTAYVAASYTTALTGSNNDLVYTAIAEGTGGNAITITYVNPGTPSASLSVTVSGNDITVHLATNGSSAITSTATLIKAAIIASSPASSLVGVVLAPGNTGAGVVTALSTQNLAGGAGTNLFQAADGGKPEFLRVLDKLIVLNGDNQDLIAFIDLSTPGFPVSFPQAVDDPSGTLSASPTTITNSGSFKIYYAYSYTTQFGETELSTILDYTVSSPRDQWQTLSTPGKLAITRSDLGSEPAGAQFWTLYVALAATAGAIQDSDMLQLAVKLDLTIGTFTDDGSLSINLGSVAPLVNSTAGFKAAHGIVEDGNPILFGDPDNTENVYIGGGGIYALDFSINNGGYKAQPEQGTNFSVTAIIGFRNGQGIPSLTVLFSNTEGLAKQSVLEQQTVNYGDQSFSVWGVTEQHYGAAGVAATVSAINYNGKLLFLSTDGFMSMNTQPLRQNVIATAPISIQRIDKLVRTIKNSAMNTVVGAGWDNKYMWTVPTNGFDTPQQILIADDNNAIQDQSAWYTLDIASQWIGVVSPKGASAFVYVCQGNKTYKLLPGTGTFDTKNGVPVPFSTKATGPLIPMGGTAAHNRWQANVQTIFYVRQLIGTITVGVTYRNQNGKLKTKTKTFNGPSFTPSAAGGWGDTQYTYGGFPQIPGWRSSPAIVDKVGLLSAQDIRIPVQIDDLTNEAQWFYTTPVGYNNYQLRAISFEGINLGVAPDIQ